MLQPFASPRFGSAAMRGAGEVLRTARTILIAWFDLAKQQTDDLTATVERMASCRSPAGLLALQTAYLGRAGDRAASQVVVVADLTVRLAGRMVAGGPRWEAAPASGRNR